MTKTWNGHGVVLAEIQGHRCYMCLVPFPSKYAVTVDHVTPRWVGGRNGYGNIAAACFGCNNRKHERMPTGCELIWLEFINAELIARGIMVGGERGLLAGVAP